MPSVRVSGFKPSVNGLHYLNNWPNVPDYMLNILGQSVSIGNASNGLCGGMVFTVADLFEAGLLPPPDTTNPAEGSDAFNYIVARLTNSFDYDDVNQYLSWIQMSDHDTWIAHGLAWHEINEEWPKIRADLDSNTLSPLGLVHGQEPPTVGFLTGIQDLGGCHQVLAWGYDLNGTSLKIYIYDPDNAGDNNCISLDIGNSAHTTPISVSNWADGTYRGFFRTHYAFHDPRTAISGAFGVTVVSSPGFPNGGSRTAPTKPNPPSRPDQLLPNEGLTVSQSITSADGRFRLILQSDGNLVLYANGRIPLWASNTDGHPEVFDAVMQSDGNLVIYDVNGRPLWASNTNGRPGAHLIAQNDGNLVIYGANNTPLWASNTVVPAQPAAPTRTDRLLANQGLTVGQSIISGDGRFRLILQTDGNLVLYTQAGVPMWASNTAGHTDAWDVVMQADGNLVIYDVRSRAIWASNTNGHPGPYLVAQNDGNLVIYDSANRPLWATNTVVPAQPSAPTKPDQLLINQGLIAGQSITSTDGRFRLILQSDGNLVLYAAGAGATWASNTWGHPNVWDAIMQNDGNLVVYDLQGKALWASNTNGHPGAYLIVQTDGNLVIYDAANHPLWASNTVRAAAAPAA
jgi:hypothetical protein